MKLRLFIYVLFLTFIQATFAQYFRYLNIENGLSSHKVLQIQKDATGFMWFVTYMGIDRYDGSEIKSYKFSYNGVVDNNYLTSTKMMVDKNGVIWVTIQDGRVYKYDKTIDDFSLEINLPQIVNKQGFLVYHAYFDSFDRIWISTTIGLYIYDLGTKNIQEIRVLSGVMPSTVTNKNYNEYYIGTDQGVFTIRDDGNAKFSLVENNTLTENCGRVISLLYHKYKLYIGTESKGAFVLDAQSKKSISLSSAIAEKPIRAIKVADNGEILIGCDGMGMYVISSDDYRLINHYMADNNILDGIQANSVYDILVDESQSIWIGTFTNGVTIIQPHTSDINVIKHEYRNYNSLINNCVNALFEDSDGDMWYGTDNGVSCFFSKEKKWHHYLNDRVHKAVILSITQDAMGRIWVGSYGIGLYCIDKKNGTIKSYRKGIPTLERSINTDYIFSLLADDENLWIGGILGNLTQYNIYQDNYKQHRIESVGVMQELNDSILLCGGAVGFSILNRNTGIFRTINYMDGGKDLYAVRSFYIENASNIWLATEGNGLVRYNMQTEKFDTYKVENGLLSNYIYGAEGDDEGRLWFTTERDLSYMELQSGKVVNMGEYMGVNSLNYNPEASYRRKNGNIVFGSTDGAVEFAPIGKPDGQTGSRLIFTDFKLFYNSVKVGENSPLDAAINETSSISLAHNQNSFSFNFSSINFRYPKSIEYNYKLEGFDQQWYKAQNKIVNYTNINPGRYSFRLQAVEKDSGELIEERVIQINIAKPLWQSGWAIAAYILFLLLIIYFVVQYLNYKIDKRNSKEKIQFFINVAHDIRTPVSLIKAPLSELEENENLSLQGQSALQIAIKNTERLFMLVTQLLDFQKADLSALRFIVSENELLPYMQEKMAQFSVQAGSRHHTLTFHTECVPPFRVWLDREKMDRILNNLLSNAIKYTPDGGQINVTLTEDDKKWYLSVKDTGMGIPQSEQKYLFKRFFRARNAINSREPGSGIGLLLTRKLVKLHQGEITFESKEGAGTEFRLAFFKGNDYFQKNNRTEGNMNSKLPSVKVPVEQVVTVKETTESVKEIPLPTENISDTSTVKEKILLVEDNDEMRTYLRNSLSTIYTIIEGLDGQDALEKIPEVNPDLIISDIMMPRMNGDAMCRIIKSSVETSHIPIILLTALTEKKNIVKGLDDGADDYVTKPFDITVLKARIRNLLRNRQKIRDIVVSTDTPYQDAEYISPLDKEFMEKVVILIEEHMENTEFSINNLCNEMAMSRSSLYNKLKAITGQGPNDFIRIVRLKKAAELLKSQRYNVTEAAILTGFPDTKYFSTAFKKQFGQSPSKFGK